MKTTVTYEDAKPETKEALALSCCDLPSHDLVTNTAEFDVEACAPGTPRAECTRRYESVMPMVWPEDGHSHVQLLYALPHVHEGGISCELQDAVTNQTICSATVADGGIIMGTGTEPANERGYITGFRECTWGEGDGPTFPYGHPMRIIAVYNATRRITGAMARTVTVGWPHNATM